MLSSNLTKHVLPQDQIEFNIAISQAGEYALSTYLAVMTWHARLSCNTAHGEIPLW
jgi:uncharacterized membrane protein YciS (DUF1049 family)